MRELITFNLVPGGLYVLTRDTRNAPMRAKSTIGDQTARTGEMRPLEASWVPTLEMPVKRSQRATAAATLEALPWRLSDMASGAVKSAMTRGRKSVV